MVVILTRQALGRPRTTAPCSSCGSAVAGTDSELFLKDSEQRAKSLAECFGMGQAKSIKVSGKTVEQTSRSLLFLGNFGGFRPWTLHWHWLHLAYGT